MSTLLSVYIDEATEARMRKIAEQLDRKVEELAESAISEAALTFYRHDPAADPAREILVEGARL